MQARKLNNVLWLLTVNQIAFLTFHSVDLDSSVCIVTGYGMDCHRIKYRWGATLSFTVHIGPVTYLFPFQGR